MSNNDHCTIGLDLLFRIPKRVAYKRLMWDFKNANFEEFRQKLNAADFSFCHNINDVNMASDKCSSSFLQIAKAYIPWKMVTVWPSDKSWYNGYLRQLLRRKKHYHSQAKRN